MKSPERLGHSGDWRDLSRLPRRRAKVVILILLALMVRRIVISIKIRLTFLD